MSRQQAPEEAASIDPGECASMAEPGDLGWALATLLRAHVRAAELVLSDLPGGARAYRLLAASAEHPLPSQLALAEATGLDRTVVTYLLDDLVAAGLVERQADPHDRRARRIVVTPTGSTRLADFRQRLSLVTQHVCEALDEDDALQLRRLLDRAAHGVREATSTNCRHVTEFAEVAEGVR